MSDVINLRGARKARERDERATLAAQNRLKYGKTRAEREKTEAEQNLADRRLDDHRLSDRPKHDGPL